ncbi:hypothetical protein [Xenorhabdus hominickii]|uniref:Uncharacterized protein n=1 Tax=Xenorhabdus hominickii TaxID=351679 RepID=A0A2G0Q444_XENHO|nr:hypothetical protein [Xenorhabdus hominickii]AOM42606.1 hypothetical protein A9255_19885 [Xenorhabdus hominickii]PHM52231.1 hypothetical protein Xhom_04611 [Xenorhabdus hominickii]PHM53961.1 hypothetical protein Xhom_03029 [Xenorhabdus hominickii]
MNLNKKAEEIIAKHKKLIAWKPAKAVAALVKIGMSESEAKEFVNKNSPERKPHKPHNSHAKPVNLEALSTHYIVVGDYDLLGLKHQDALIAAIRNGKGKSSWRDESMAVTLFGLVKAYPIITTAEVNKFLNRGAFIDSIPLFIDGEVIEGEAMPSANNESVKDVFRAVKQLKKITEHLADTGTLTLNKYLDRVPTDEDVKRAVGIVAPAITNPHFHKIDYARQYNDMPVDAHAEDSKRIINEWKNELKIKGGKKPNSETLASATDSDLATGTNEELPAQKYRTGTQENKQG